MNSPIDELVNFAKGKVYILRDDLLGDPFNGSKHRKYWGLFEYLKKLKPPCVIIPGSIASNHFVTSIDYCQKQGLPCLGVTKKPYGPLRANAQAAIKLLDNLIYVNDPFEEAKRLHEKMPGSFLMPLGGFHPEAAKTSLSLGYQIMDFHQKTPLEAVFFDAGTGLQAASALLAMQERGFQGTAYVITMGPLDMAAVISQVSEWTARALPTFNVIVKRPDVAKKYGSSHPIIERFAIEFYNTYSIRLDAVYNSKLFYTAKQLLQEEHTLIVHSGGTYAGTIVG